MDLKSGNMLSQKEEEIITKIEIQRIKEKFNRERG